ncbi:MAG: hypothetical protein C0594_11080 [Marinilabiliales bacterium]|nr:MAG: hypothetical protein C0594_11080 [Marinilabiliales bacterium]
MINGVSDAESVIIGLSAALLVSILFCKNCNVFSDMKLSPKAILFTVAYIFIFLFELIKSNLDVAKRVVSPSLPINPGIIEVKTKLKSPMARMILANSITLTPGTLTIDIKGDSLFIHWIDVCCDDQEKATQVIVSKFEKYLEVIYG